MGRAARTAIARSATCAGAPAGAAFAGGRAVRRRDGADRRALDAATRAGGRAPHDSRGRRSAAECSRCGASSGRRAPGRNGGESSAPRRRHPAAVARGSLATVARAAGALASARPAAPSSQPSRSPRAGGRRNCARPPPRGGRGPGEVEPRAGARDPNGAGAGAGAGARRRGVGRPAARLAGRRVRVRAVTAPTARGRVTLRRRRLWTARATLVLIRWIAYALVLAAVAAALGGAVAATSPPATHSGFVTPGAPRASVAPPDTGGGEGAGGSF